MTPNERNQTVQILKKLSKFSSIIVVEHDMEFVRDLNCRVNVLNEEVFFLQAQLILFLKMKKL